ncbi:MAG: SprT-like domain-containing protein [Planctomycetes bacterium]|nr:SprT-like domain-containing protein [Planctomycetota bacterium]
MIAPIDVPPNLQRAWIRRLSWHFDLYNQIYAGCRLRAPIFLIGRSAERLGQWNGRDRTITIAESHILEHSWESVLETVRHEMAHQYVEEILLSPNAPPHGEAFQRACRILRVDPASAAAPGTLQSLSGSASERDKMLTRIKELLAMAGSPNEHEAATAMRLVHKFLLKYNLDLAELDSQRDFAIRHLGTCSARIQHYEYALANILNKHYFVETVWTFSYDALRNRPGRILEIAGTPENLEIAEYVHHYVMNLTERLWKAYRRANPGSRSTRKQYLAGLMEGFAAKLDSQSTELSEKNGLIWRGDPLLEEYHRYRYPHLVRLRGAGVARSDGYDAGLRDGREITIHRGVSGNSADRGRRIGDGR